jgi:hypothetical protein
MNGEEFLIETNLDADGSPLPEGVIATVDGQKLKANVDRVIGLIQQLAQDPQAELVLEQVEVSIKITASGEVVILGTGAKEASGAQNITLKFRQRQIAPTIPTQVQPQVTAPPVPTEAERYSKLEKLLLSAQWQAANRETWDLMCDALGKNLGTYLTAQDMQQIPCADLARIDRLWQHHSQGNFGLSAQKKAYQTAMS